MHERIEGIPEGASKRSLRLRIPTSLSSRLATTIQLSGMPLSFVYPLQMLFFISGIARLGVLLVLFPTFQEVRRVQSLRSRELLFNMVDIRSIRGLQFGLAPVAAQKTSSRAARLRRDPGEMKRSFSAIIRTGCGPGRQFRNAALQGSSHETQFPELSH